MGPDQIGDGNYLPDSTVGIARFGDLKISEAEPFDACDVHPTSISSTTWATTRPARTRDAIAKAEVTAPRRRLPAMARRCPLRKAGKRGGVGVRDLASRSARLPVVT